MKLLGIAILFLFCSKIIFAQKTGGPKTYALVIGVAKYLDPENTTNQPRSGCNYRLMPGLIIKWFYKTIRLLIA